MVEQIQALLGQPDFWLGFFLGALLGAGNLWFMRRLMRRGLAADETGKDSGSVSGRFLPGYLAKQVILVGAAAVLILVIRINVVGLVVGLLLAHFALRGRLIASAKGTRHGRGTRRPQ